MPEKPFRYPFGIIGNLCNFTYLPINIVKISCNCITLTNPCCQLRYLPFIIDLQFNFSTVYTALLRLISVAKSQGQAHIMETADIVIYSKVQQIIWSKPELQELLK